ncbi:hypothetical protein ABPG75_004210 [Micractinium tetrahymenae]
MGAAVRPEEAAYTQAFKDVNSHVSLDAAWAKVRAAIESHCGLLGKQHAVRVRNWVKKLSEETANVVWKKNRNAYARLLLEQLRCGRLDQPFSGQPPGGPLPTLPKHLAYAFKPARASGSPRAVVAEQAQWAAAAPPAAETAALAQRQFSQPLPRPPPQQQQQRLQAAQAAAQEQQRQLSATEQLDAYLGRADFRRAQYAGERAVAAAAAAAAEDSDDGIGGYNGAGGLKYLPGTRMQLRGAEGRRVDKQQLEDVGWQPSKLELEARLGASRERQAELEWRLGQMEGLLRQHAALLQGQAAAPLGSLLDAIDDGHVSPPKERSSKQQLEELIERYEAKKKQWQSPAWSAAAAAGGAGRGAQRPPPIAPSDEEEVLRQLDNFQRQTETIRRQLGGGSGDAPAGLTHLAPPGSSLAAHTSNGSDWETLLEGTPARQQPTGLRGGGYTPHGGVAARSMALFDVLPPSPAALAASRQLGANRHVHHAGHHLHPSSQQPQAQPAQPSEAQQHQHQHQHQQILQQPAASSTNRLAASAAAAMQQRPRSPIGPDIRHTKKSAAAAERASAAALPSPGAAAALQRLKSKRQAGIGAPLSPGFQEQQHRDLQQQQRQAAGSSPFREEQQWQQDAGVQAQSLQHDEGVQVRQAAEAGVQAPTPPAPPQLPPDSNAALVAEVRQLRSKLFASLQKHAPELASAGADVSSSLTALATPRKWQAEAGRVQLEQPADSSWRLAAGPSIAAAVEAAVQPPASAPLSVMSASHSSRRLTEPSWGSGWLDATDAAGAAAVPEAAAGAAAAGVGSSSKFRLTDDLSLGSLGGARAAGRHRLTDLSAATPSSLLGGGSSLARLGSLEPSSASLGILENVESGFDLGAFEAQTEALRARLAGL